MMKEKLPTPINWDRLTSCVSRVGPQLNTNEHGPPTPYRCQMCGTNFVRGDSLPDGEPNFVHLQDLRRGHPEPHRRPQDPALSAEWRDPT